jgi:sugar phosphate isomerase/epimerase
MDRKDFIKQVGILGLGSTIIPQNTLANISPWVEARVLKKIGVQLFSLPTSLENDFEGSIAMLAAMGYREIVLYGPYYFSTPPAKERWKAVTPMLGFKGSGYFGRTENQIKDLFESHSLSIPAIHTDLDTLEKNMPRLGEAGAALGFTYVILPSIPDERRQSLDDYKRMAEVFNGIGENAKKEGLRFAYHNHGYGLSEVDGQIPLHLIFDNTDPDLVFFEMDLFWTISGKADPVEYLKKYKNRYHLMHVKDMKELKTFSGDGGNASQWIELFPNMTTAGDGVIDLEAILQVAKKNGVRHFFVEQDMVENPEQALKSSIQFLKTL